MDIICFKYISTYIYEYVCHMNRSYVCRDFSCMWIIVLLCHHMCDVIFVVCRKIYIYMCKYVHIYTFI